MLNLTALQRAMQAQGATRHGPVTERCPHLFADVPVFISAAQMRQMREVIGAVERVVAMPGWKTLSFPRRRESSQLKNSPRSGVMLKMLL